VWVTGEVLMALGRKPLPVAPVPLPTRHHASPTRPGVHGRTAHRRPSARAHRRAATAAAHAPVPPGSLTLARDVGVLTALALAPVGVG
jgi:hypothetical protein